MSINGFLSATEILFPPAAKIHEGSGKMADFAHYTDRRKFSDAVHDKMAGKVYRCLGGELDAQRDEKYRLRADLTDGIEYSS